MCEYEFCNDIHGRFPLSLFQYFLARPFLLDPFFIHESFLGFIALYIIQIFFVQGRVSFLERSNLSNPLLEVPLYLASARSST